MADPTYPRELRILRHLLLHSLLLPLCRSECIVSLPPLLLFVFGFGAESAMTSSRTEVGDEPSWRPSKLAGIGTVVCDCVMLCNNIAAAATARRNGEREAVTVLFAGRLGSGEDVAGDVGGGPCLLLILNLAIRGGYSAGCWYISTCLVAIRCK